MKHRIIVGHCVAVVVLATAAAARADLLASDSFVIGGADGYVDTKPFDAFPSGSDAQNAAAVGFSTPWNSGGTGAWRSVNDGLSAPGLGGATGGSALFQWDTEIGVRVVKRNLTNPPSINTGTEYWMTALIRLNQVDPDFDGYAYAGFSSDLNDDNSTQGLKVGVQGNGSDAMNLVLRHRSGSVTQQSLILDGIAPGQTHLLLIRAQVNSDLGGGGTPGNDNISIWLDPASTASLAALGTPDVAVENFSLFSSSALRYLTFEASDITGAGVNFDELRLASSQGAVILPEPGTATLALLTLAAWTVRRRRAA